MGKDEGRKMKRIFCLVTVLLTLALGTSVFGQGVAFTAGDVVVYRMGDGSQLATNLGQSVFLDEYKTNDIANAAGCGIHCTPLTPRHTYAMPTAWIGNQAPLIANGGAQIEGVMTLSQDGRYLLVPGFGATVDQLTNLYGYAFPGVDTNADVSASYATNAVTEADVPRVIGLVDGNGNIYTSTVLTNGNEDGDEIRGAASIDGTNIWYEGGDGLRVKYTTRGSMVSTQVCALTTMEPTRAVGIFGNALYLDKNDAFAVATNTTYTSQSISNIVCTTTNIVTCTNITSTTTLTGCTTNITPAGCVTNLQGCITNTVYTTNIVVGCSTNYSGCTTNFVVTPLNPFGGALPVYTIPTNFVQISTVTNGSQMAFVMFNLANANQGGAAPDTLYLADSAAFYQGENRNYGGAVEKYCYVSGTGWVYEAAIGAEDAFGVAGYQNGTNVSLYITEGTNSDMYYYIDKSGYNPYPNNPQEIAEAPRLELAYGNNGNVNVRGVCVVPQGGDSGTISAGPGVITVGPPYGAYFRGPQGGPFVPASNSVTYTVANLGATTTNYTLHVSGSPAYFSASPNNVSLSSGGTQPVTVNVSSSANSANGGQTYTNNLLIYRSDFTSDNAAVLVATIPCTLVVDAFYLTPTTNFISFGEPGVFASYSPSSVIYTLSNATPAALNFSAFTSNNWDTLSCPTATQVDPNHLTGSVASNGVAYITVSISPNIDSLLVPGSYDDYLTFSNTSAQTQLTVKPEIIAQIGFGIFDDFSTFSNANVVGQENWNGGAVPPDANPVQIVNVSGVNEYVVPGGCVNGGGNTSQQPYKYIAAGPITNAMYVCGTNVVAGTNVYVKCNVPTYAITGVSVTFTNAPSTANYVFEQGTPYLAWNDAGIIKNGSGYSWTTELDQYETGGGEEGSAIYTFGTQYQVFFVTDFVESNAYVFVNPPGPSGGITDAVSLVNNETAGPVLAVHSMGQQCPAADCLGNSAQGWDSITLGQYSGAVCPGNEQPGYFVTRVAASTNYVDVWNWLQAGLTPPPTNHFTASPTNGPAPLAVQFTDTSSGSPTSWNWQFGDCDSSPLQSPLYTYDVAGVYTAKLVVANLSGSGVGNAIAVITVSGCPTITLLPSNLPGGTEGAAYSQAITASGGAAPYTYAVTAGSLAGSGLSLSSAGTLSGASPVAGTYTFTVTATDHNGCMESQAYTVTVQTKFASWQQYYFPGGGSLSAAGVDAYGTGMSNTNKFLAGFVGNNPAAYLHITSVARQNGNNINITYLGASGDTNYPPGFAVRTNVLDYTTGTANGGYTSANWTLGVQTNVLGVGVSTQGGEGTGLGTTTNFIDVGGASASTTRYYRVRVPLP
jgi:PKD repeat protein